MRPNVGIGDLRCSGTKAIGAAIGISCEPRPTCSVVRMPYISPLMVGRATMIEPVLPCRLVTR